MTATRILIRRGTAAEWTTSNPVLLEGEQGYETDTGKIKIGDGTSNWSSLDYNFETTAYTDADVDTHLNQSTATNGQVLSWNGSDYDWTTLSIPSAYTDSDVDTHLNQSTAANNQVLSWDGSDYAWINQSEGGSYADADVDTHLNVSSAANNQVLSWDGTDYTWINQSEGGGLTEVTYNSRVYQTTGGGDLLIPPTVASEGGTITFDLPDESLTWSTSGTWRLSGETATDLMIGKNINTQIAGNGSRLELAAKNDLWLAVRFSSIDLDGATVNYITESSVGSHEFYNFGNKTLDFRHYRISANASFRLAQFDTTTRDGLNGDATPVTGDLIYNTTDDEIQLYNGSAWEAVGGGGSYSDSDVDTHLNVSGAANNQVLSWDGTDYAWIDQDGSYADADVDTHLNVSSAANNQVLSWNGSDYAWTDQSAGGGSDIWNADPDWDSTTVNVITTSGPDGSGFFSHTFSIKDDTTYADQSDGIGYTFSMGNANQWAVITKDSTGLKLKAKSAIGLGEDFAIEHEGSSFNQFQSRLILRNNGVNGLEIGENGKVFAPNLPTVDPVEAGQLWNDGGTLKISSGT